MSSSPRRFACKGTLLSSPLPPLPLSMGDLLVSGVPSLLGVAFDVPVKASSSAMADTSRFRSLDEIVAFVEQRKPGT